MKYYVIYSFDCATENTKNAEDLSEKWKKIFEQTEDDDSYDLAYLGDIWAEEGNGFHRKYCGELTKEQLKEFIWDMGLYYDCETMGSLTLEYGHLPAFSMRADNMFSDFIDCCYVSPLIENPLSQVFEGPEEFDELPSDLRDILVDQVSERMCRNFERIQSVFQAS
jgi:hypothetical protein